MQWNTAIEVGLGANQTLTGTYVGADGRRLLRQALIRPPELTALAPDGIVLATQNGGYSHYNALQVQFQRRMSQGLQALISYNLAKSSDTDSSDTLSDQMTAASASQTVPPPFGALRLRYPALAVRSRFL